MNKKVVIYGAGQYGKIFLELLRHNGVEIDFFIDEYIHDTLVEGKPVLRLAAVTDKASVQLYISVQMGAYVGLPGDDLWEQGFDEVIDFATFYARYPEMLHIYNNRHCLWPHADPKETLNRDALAQVRTLLSDQKSRDLLDQIIAFRQSPEPSRYVMPDRMVEYFPEDVDLFSKLQTVRLVDCGAFIGDTAASLMKHQPRPVEYVASFEPDTTNVERMAVNYDWLRVRNPGTYFFTFACGVWSHAGMLSFDARGSAFSRIVSEPTDNNNLVRIPVIALDLVLAGAAPNFIKMDVEGAEYEALQGAHGIISRYRPVLAICVYHNPHDLWQLPLYLHERYPFYQMSLREHCYMSKGTVLYCVPSEKA